MSGVTITDAQGIEQLTGSFADNATIRTSRAVNLRLVAGAAAPTAGGRIVFTAIHGTTSRPTDFQTFLLTAAGLPVGATLTLSVDGTAVGPVTTGPGGKLFVKASQSVFPLPPKGAEVVNVLPDSVNLLTAKSFTVSDLQGNVLLSGAVGN